MADESHNMDEMRREIAYYKCRLDELAGENFQLDYQLSGLRKEIKQKRQAFTLLSNLQQTIGAEKEISHIFHNVLLAINATLGMDKTIVLSPTDQEDDYQPTQWTGFTEEGRSEEFAQRMAKTRIRLPRDFAAGTGAS